MQQLAIECKRREPLIGDKLKEINFTINVIQFAGEQNKGKEGNGLEREEEDKRNQLGEGEDVRTRDSAAVNSCSALANI